MNRGALGRRRRWRDWLLEGLARFLFLLLSPGAALTDLVWMVLCRWPGHNHRWAYRLWLAGSFLSCAVVYACLLGRIAVAAWFASQMELTFAQDVDITIHLSGGTLRLLADALALSWMGLVICCMFLIRFLNILTAGLVADPYAAAYLVVGLWFSQRF